MTTVKIEIKRNRCKGCELCVNACPKGAIRMSQELNERGVHFVEVVDDDK